MLETVLEYSKSSKIVLHKAMLTHRYLVYGPLVRTVIMLLPYIVLLTTLVVSIILTASTCYCCPPEDALLAAFRVDHPDQYAMLYIQHYIEHQLPTDNLPVAVQVLVNFDIHLSQSKTLDIMGMNNVYEVYFTLLDWSSVICPERDQPEFIYCQTESNKNFLVDITAEKHSEIEYQLECLLDHAEGRPLDVSDYTYKRPTRLLDPGVNEEETAGPAGWTGDQQVEQGQPTSSSSESSDEIPSGQNSPNQLANSHETPSGQNSPNQLGSPINGLGRLERSSSPEQPLEEFSGRMVKRLKK
jgi:hypothetical protein